MNDPKMTAVLGLRERWRRRATRWPEALARFCSTIDPHDEETPVKLFPIREKPHLRRILATLREYSEVLVEKSAQVMATWSVCVWIYFLLRTRPKALIFIQSKKEADANDVLQRVRFLHDSLPGWLKVYREDKNWLRLGMEHKYCRLDFHAYDPSAVSSPRQARGLSPSKAGPNGSQGADVLGSQLRAIPQGGDQIRMHTVTLVYSDELAFQPQGREAYRAIKPRIQDGGQFIGTSTPNGRNFFWELGQRESVHVLRVHYSEDPAKDEAWVQRERAKYTEEEWAREQEIRYDVYGGRRVFSGFREDRHVRQLRPIAGRRIIRAWDFGYHHPAAVWMQVLPSGRLLILRSILGEDEELDAFAGRVQVLSGLWFPGFDFEDWGDPAGEQTNDFGESPCTYLRKQGIAIRTLPQAREMGRDEIRRHLRPRADGMPGILVDAGAPHVIEGFKGAWRYPEAKPGEKVRDELVEDGEHEHVYDATRYGVVGARVQALKERRRR